MTETPLEVIARNGWPEAAPEILRLLAAAQETDR